VVDVHCLRELRLAADRPAERAADGEVEEQVEGALEDPGARLDVERRRAVVAEVVDRPDDLPGLPVDREDVVVVAAAPCRRAP
jgi:hypothetical protein